MNKVRNLCTSEMVFRISFKAIFADSLKPKAGISSLIGGSGTHLNVNKANPYHQAADEAITNGMTQSPVSASTMPR